MNNSDLLPSLLCKINENQLALEAAIMELTLWVVGLLALVVEAQTVTAGEHAAQVQLGDSPATTGTQEPRSIAPQVAWCPGERYGVIP